MKRYFTAVFALSRAYLTRFSRDKTSMFFTFLFPLVFLFVFGSLNSNTTDELTFNVAVINESETSFAADFETQIRDSETFDVSDDLVDVESAKESMGRSEIDSILVFPEEFGAPNEEQLPTGDIEVYYSESSPQGGQTVAAVVEGVLNEINSSLGQPDPLLGVVQKTTSSNNLSSFDYVFSGLIGFSMLSLGIFGFANQMPAEKKTGSFRRLRASPITKSQVVFANLFFYLLIGAMSIALMVAAAIFMFDFSMQGSWFAFTFFVLLGLITILGFGLAIGGGARNENQSAVISNLVAFPLMFLSGVFFPRFLMPEWVQAITGYLPLSPVVDGIRMIATEGKTLIDTAPELGLMLLWAVVIYAIAIKVFKWE